MNRLQSMKMKLTRVLTIIPVALLLGVGVLGTVVPEQAYAASSSVPEMIPSTGKDFWLTFMQNKDDGDIVNVDLTLHIVAEGATKVTIKKANGTLLAEKTLAADEGWDYSIPTTPTDERPNVYVTSSGKVEAKGVRVESDAADITLYIGNRIDGAKISFDASPVLPVTSLGTEYVAQTYSFDKKASELAVVGTKAGTTVTIIPKYEAKNDLGSTFSPGVPIVKTLGAGDVFRLAGLEDLLYGYNMLSGTIIYASNPIAVFNGGADTEVEYTGGYDGDHVFEQSIPVSAWGKRFLVSEMHGFPGSPSVVINSEPTQYSLTAIYDNTEVRVNGVLLCTLNKGETNTTDFGGVIPMDYNEDPKFVETSEPVICYAYLTNGSQNTFKMNGIGAPRPVGEPSTVLIPDIRQAVKKASFNTYSAVSGANARHYANVFVRNADKGGMRLNGSDISGQFTALSEHFAGDTVTWAYAKVELTTTGTNILSNDNGPFLAYVYGVQLATPRGYAMATSFNLAPAAPVVKIGGEPVEHGAVLEYCNKHPGVDFTAIIDYPHDSIRWELGDNGVTSTAMSASHMYGKTINEADTTHNVRLYVYHHSPILPSTDPRYKDTDSVCVSLVVHPVYYDTLKTKVAANKLEYIWNKSSNPAFGIAGKGELSVGPVTMGKDAPNANNKWTSANDHKFIKDSLVYETKHDCDSIFYLQLEVVPDIIKNDPNASVCQKEDFTWTGHAAGTGHKVWQKNLTTNVSTQVTAAGIVTDVDGTFEIRDTMVSKVFPYPDSIHILNLTIHTKPEILTLVVRDTCVAAEKAELNFTVNAAAKKYQYNIDGGSWSAAADIPSMPMALSLSGLSAGNHTLNLRVVTTTTPVCSDEKSVSFKLHKTPVFNWEAVAPEAQCYKASEDFVLTYSYGDDATHFRYKVLKNGSAFQDWSDPIALKAAPNNKLSIDASTWADATYKVVAKGLLIIDGKETGCESDEKEKSFVINRQPTVSDVSVVSQCDNEETTTLTFKTADATSVNYYIIGKTQLLSTPVAITADGAHTIDTLHLTSISGLTAETEYTLKIVANSATCHSDTVSATFKVYPMPVVKVNTLASECYPADDNKTVTFDGSTTADSIKWVLKRGSDIVRQQTTYVKRADVTLTKASDLNAAGLYTFTITAIKTANKCEVLSPDIVNGEIQFTLYDQANIALSGTVANQCEGDPIVLTVKNKYADTLMYEVKQGATVILKGGKGIKGGSGTERTTELSIPTGSGAGKIPASTTGYTITVSADNLKNCGGNSVTTAAFYVHKIPSITAAGLSNNSLCELADKTELSVTTDAGKLIYEVKKGATTWVEATTVDTPAGGKLTLLTDTLSDGDYTITLTPKSTTTPSCTGAPFTPLTFTVHPKPVVNTFDNVVVCFGDDKAVAAFTATDASTYKFQLKDKNGSTVVVTPTITTGSVTIPLSSTMTAALSPYKMRLQAVSVSSCLSDWKEATLTINPQPAKPSNITFTEPCADATTMYVTFTKDAVGNCAVAKIVETGTVTLAGTPVEGTSRTIPVSITGVTAGNTYTLRIYTFNNITNCQSDSVDKTFTVWPLPTITPVDTFACENDAAVNVRYSSTNAKTYTYELTGYGITTPRTDTKNAETSGYISVDISGLEANHDYTLSVTAVSEKGCNTAAATTSKITIRPRPSVTLSDVADFCQGTASITVSYTGLTGTTDFDYFVTKSGSPVTSGTKTGMTAPNGSFTLNPSTWGYSASDDDFAIELIAKANGCGSQGDEQKKFFTVNPLPTITADAASVTLCEKEDAAVFTFTTEFADTYSYWLSGTGAPTFAETDKEVPTGGKVTITWPKASQVDGDFTLNVTVKNGCATSAAATTALKVNNQPTLALTVPDVCNGDPAGLNFNYEVSSDAERYDLHVWKTDRSKHFGGDDNFALPAKPTGTISKSFSPWGSAIPAGSYIAVMRVRNSTTTCESDSMVVPFTIHPIPTVNSAFTIEAVCQNGSPRVDFKHTNGTTVKYWIDGVEKSAVAINGTQDAAWFNADITGIAAGTNHKMKLQVISGTSPACESAESSERTFTIYPLPTITTYDTTAIHPVASVGVRYSANASTYTYVMTGAGIPSLNPGTGSGTFSGGKIPVNTANLAPGTYELTVTAKSATSAGGCEKTATSTIVIYDPTSIEITEPIAGKCAENTTDKISITITTTFADKYSYVVKLGETEIESKADQATTNNGATPFEKTFQLDKTTWTAGTYSISITAKNTDTGVTKEDASTFTIYPTPEITFTQPSAICEAEVSSVNVTYTNTGNYANKIKYHVDKLLPTPVADIVPEQEISANGTIILTGTDVWEDGTYRISATPTSEHGCEGTEKYTDLVVNNQPEATLNPIEENICAGTGYLNATFTASTDARAYAFRILNSSDQPVSGYAGGSAIPAPYSGGSFAVDVHTLPVGTNYKLELKTQTEAGCWSVADTKSFSVRDTFLFKTEAKICKSETYTWTYSNRTVDITGISKGAGVHTIDSVYKTVYGCDSVYRLILTVGEEYTIYEDKTICEDKPFTWRGTDYPARAQGYYEDITKTYPTVAIPGLACDSTYVLRLTVTDSEAPNVTNVSICHGESYDWIVKDCHNNDVTLMKGLTATTHQKDTLPCDDPELCNPIYELNLTVWPEYTAPEETHMLCAGETFIWHGQTITEAGTYEWSEEDSGDNGCPRVHRIVVTKLVPEVKTINQTVCYGTPVVFNGHTYSGLNVGKHELRDTIAAAGGCDSVYLMMNLTVGDRYYDSIVVTECDSYLWHGTTYTQSGVYREELASVNGCDSIAVLNLTINKSYSFTETYDILDTQLPFTVHEFTYEAAGTYDRTFTTVAGCDSTYHLTINVHTEPLPKDTVEHTMCEGETYTWQGADYTASGWYSKTEPGVAIHVLHLTVNPKYSNTTYVHHCGDSYMWQGTPRTASGTYTWEGHSLVTGCDSTEILVLTLGQANTNTVNITACRYEPVNVGSKTFLATETSYPDMQETFTNASGCDSTVTYKITVADRAYDAAVMDAFCEGTPYIWDVNGHTHTYTEAGTYFDTVMTDGCATKISTLELTANPKYRFDEDVEVWENALPYVWVGHKADTLLKTDGDYYDNHTTAEGCDSIHHIHFHVNWVTRDTTNTAANPEIGCGSVTWNGKPYYESCLASDTTWTGTPAKYSYIEFRYIVVTQQYSVVEPEFTICRNEAFTWHGQNYEANHFTAGDHLLTYTRPLKYNGQTVAGCDSTFTATVHVVETFFSEISKEVCPNELPYLWRDKQLNAAGDYTDVVPSPTGCDSTFVLHLALKAVTGPQEKNDIICQGSTYEWLESGTKLLDIPANEPGEFTYYHWYNPNAGTCPDYKTYYKLNLTVGKNYNEDPELHLDSALTKHICQGESFDWFGETRKVEGADVVQINDHMFMKNFHYEIPSVDGCDSLIADLTLVEHKKYERTIEEDTTICNLYIWDGETVTTEGDEITYTRTYHLYPELGECGDSILTRKFNVLHSEVQTIDKDTCDEFFWDKTGLLYTESGTYIHNVPQLGGLCDKIYTLNLTIRKKGVKDIDKEACYSYVWTTEDGGDGRTCDHTDTYEYKLDIPSVSGCDSIHYLHLTVKDSVVKWLDPVEACDSYEWKGTTYTSSRIFREVSEGSNGCDSITWMKLTIKHSSPVTNIDTTACRRYDDSEHGIHLDESNAGENNFSFTYENTEGCDSVVNIKVTITTPDTVEHTFKACDSITWNEVTYTEIGTYDKYQDFATHNDCSLDSVILLHLTIGANVATEITKAEWSPFIWEGDTYTESGTYTKTLEAACGCDSVVTLHLTINDPESDEETRFACQSYTWPWAEGAGAAQSTYTESGDYEVKWTNHPDVGHDSIRILHLTIKEPDIIATTVKECDSYTWHARGFTQTYTESGKYENIYNDGVCYNIDSLYLTISHTPLPVEFNDTACDVLTVNGNSYFNSIDFTENLKTVNDCDSAVNYHLKINKRKTQTVSEQACGSYLWEATGVTYTQSGSYTKVMETADGCDSVVTLNLSIYEPYNYSFSACGKFAVDGTKQYIWDNRTYTEAGDYSWTYQSVRGCDSIVTLHLTMPVDGIDNPEQVTACDEYLWHGRLLTASGAYSDTISSLVTGCDSVAWLFLTIAEHPTGEETREVSSPTYTWGNVIYYESGDYERRFPMEDGRCDSIGTLHLTFTNPLPISTELSATACDAYTWDSETFYESGVYVRNFPTLDGRDSIVKLTLTINRDTTVYKTDKLCGPYDWNGQTLTETGVYTQVLQRASGCDSVVTLTLTLCERFETSFVVEARDVYVWDGQTYTESTTETRQYTSRQGCDSLVTMVLTIVKTANTVDNAEACTQYAWADSIFTESTIHSHVFPASTGGDSVVTMTLIIHEPVYTDLVDTVREPQCSTPGYEYALPWGEMVQHTGIYTDTLESAVTGCDSIVRFHLQWCDEELCIDTTHLPAVEQCGPYTWDKTGMTYSTTGTYDYHERAGDGCEHVSLLRLTILPEAYRTIDTTACDSLYWEEKSIWIKESGYYRDTVFGGAADGCDSITIRHAIIGHAAEETIEVTSCDAYTLNGETFNESGTYIQHLTTVTGCDSTLTINLTLNPSKDSTLKGVACDDTVWNGVTLTKTGFYPMVVQAEGTGCDSVVTLQLIIYGSKDITYIDSTHCDSIKWGPDREGNDTIIYDDGIYTRTFLSSVGCDSTVTMDLRLKHHDLVQAPDTQACDSFVWNDKVYFESGTFKDTTLSTRTGCDSITTMRITINPTLYDTIYDTVPPPFYLWPTESDTIWVSGEYVDTTASLITGCDSITTLYLVMTDSIILDSIEPVRIDTLGYCPGDTVNLIYNLLKGHPTKYTLIFDTVAPRVPDYTRDFKSVLDTTELPNHGMDTLFTLVIPEYCEPGEYEFDLQMFDDYSSSKVYHYHLFVAVKGEVVSLWTDVVAIDNHEEKYIGYQWYINRDQSSDNYELIPGATKQYYSDGEDLNACYRAKLQLADSSWVYTCETCFDLRTDSLELIAYPTPAPVGQPVTIKAMGILIEKLIGSQLTITNVQGLSVHSNNSMTRREEEVNLPAGLYIAVINTPDGRTANVKFTVF